MVTDYCWIDNQNLQNPIPILKPNTQFIMPKKIHMTDAKTPLYPAVRSQLNLYTPHHITVDQ
jgi:hypothetical protein